MRRITEALNSRRKSVAGSRVLLLGLAYKANVDDDRQSPTYALMELLRGLGAEVSYHDPYIATSREEEHPGLAPLRSVPWTEAEIRSYDTAVILTPHRDVNYGQLVAWCPLIVDTRNVLAAIPAADGQVWKA
jgi:UDP-N-acetyl-D-glucosamine dehydrogenase